MEVNSNLIEIQSILRNIVKTAGELTKIKYKGGNEMKINYIIKELEDHLTSKCYINKRIPNKEFYKELDDITLFLVVNADFKDQSARDIKEFSHLINIIPTLSKCLLANIIVELDLNEFYCNALHKLPAELSEELLYEIIPCIKKCKPETSIELTYIYMKNIIKKICSLDSSNYKMVECIDKLEEVSCQILLNCSGITADQLQGYSKRNLHIHMGHSLLCLLKLLQRCQVNNDVLCKIIDDLINSICSIMKAVTVDVFCTWAEIKNNDEVLQAVIAEQAYHIIEKFQKLESAKPLIQMLSSIASKPKSLNDMIQEASSATIVLKIEQNPTNRSKWFAALLNTQVFESKETKECVARWASLCTLDDMDRLLCLSVPHKDEEDVVDIIIKCLSFFSVAEIAILMARFFNEYGLKNCLKSKNTSSQLTIILNKLEKANTKEPNKDVLLLLIQEPELVLTNLYKGCIKNQILLETLEETLKSISEVIVIERLLLKALDKVLDEYKLDSKNVKNYEKLFRVLAEGNYKLVMHFFLIPHIKNYLNESIYDYLNYGFCIYKEIVNKASLEEVDELIQISVNILEKCRWKIFDFSYVRASLCDTASQMLFDLKNLHYNMIRDENISSLQHVLNQYYLKILQSKSELDFLDYVCPNLNVDRHSECVGYLIKLLPQCVEREWFSITSTLLKVCPGEKVVQMITDTLIIVSQIVQTQIKTDNGCLLSGLKFCLQNYGLILKNIMLPLKNEQTNVSLIKCVCRLLREMPLEIINIEGMTLISLIPDSTLKGLTQDESFLSILLSMDGSEQSRIIAKRMLS